MVGAAASADDRKVGQVGPQRLEGAGQLFEIALVEPFRCVQPRGNSTPMLGRSPKDPRPPTSSRRCLSCDVARLRCRPDCPMR